MPSNGTLLCAAIYPERGGKKRIIILLLVMPALILGVRFDLSSSPLAQVKC